MIGIIIKIMIAIKIDIQMMTDINLIPLTNIPSSSTAEHTE